MAVMAGPVDNTTCWVVQRTWKDRTHTDLHHVVLTKNLSPFWLAILPRLLQLNVGAADNWYRRVVDVMPHTLQACPHRRVPLFTNMLLFSARTRTSSRDVGRSW